MEIKFSGIGVRGEMLQLQTHVAWLRETGAQREQMEIGGKRRGWLEEREGTVGERWGRWRHKGCGGEEEMSEMSESYCALCSLLFAFFYVLSSLSIHSLLIYLSSLSYSHRFYCSEPLPQGTGVCLRVAVCSCAHLRSRKESAEAHVRNTYCP